MNCTDGVSAYAKKRSGLALSRQVQLGAKSEGEMK